MSRLGHKKVNRRQVMIPTRSHHISVDLMSNGQLKKSKPVNQVSGGMDVGLDRH